MDVDATIGAIMPWPLDWAPNGWTMCNGQFAVANLPAHHHGATFTPGAAGSASVAIPADGDSNATDSVPGATMVLGKPVSGTVDGKTCSTAAKTDTLKPIDVAVPATTGTVATADTGVGTALDVSVAGTATCPPSALPRDE